MLLELNETESKRLINWLGDCMNYKNDCIDNAYNKIDSLHDDLNYQTDKGIKDALYNDIEVCNHNIDSLKDDLEQINELQDKVIGLVESEKKQL